MTSLRLCWWLLDWFFFQFRIRICICIRILSMTEHVWVALSSYFSACHRSSLPTVILRIRPSSQPLEATAYENVWLVSCQAMSSDVKRCQWWKIGERSVKAHYQHSQGAGAVATALECYESKRWIDMNRYESISCHCTIFYILIILIKYCTSIVLCFEDPLKTLETWWCCKAWLWSVQDDPRCLF